MALDTSTLRRDPAFAGAPFEALARFAEEGYVEIIIPKVAADEFGTLPGPKIEALAARRQTLRELRRGAPSQLYESIVAFEDTVAAEFAKIEAAAKSRLDSWIARTRAKVEDTRPEHGARVLARYFAGLPPFKRPKSRDDFPDAFIFEVIRDVASEGDILAVTSDGGLKAALESLPNVIVYSSVRELLESDEFDDLRSDVEAENVNRVVQVFVRSTDLFRETVEYGIVDRVAGKFVSYNDPSADEKEGPEQLYIETVGPILEWQVGSNVDYLGEGVVSIDFTATVEINVDTSTGDEFYDDLYGTSSERTVSVEGILSLKMEPTDLREPTADWSATKLVELAEVHVDDIESIDLLDREY